MNEIDTLAKALAFEYYVGAIEATSSIDKITSADALEFFETHSEEYFVKATKILQLISDSHTIRH
jgi:hypothetical protein